MVSILIYILWLLFYSVACRLIIQIIQSSIYLVLYCQQSIFSLWHASRNQKIYVTLSIASSTFLVISIFIGQLGIKLNTNTQSLVWARLKLGRNITCRLCFNIQDVYFEYLWAVLFQQIPSFKTLFPSSQVGGCQSASESHHIVQKHCSDNRSPPWSSVALDLFDTLHQTACRSLQSTLTNET